MLQIDQILMCKILLLSADKFLLNKFTQQKQQYSYEWQ